MILLRSKAVSVFLALLMVFGTFPVNVSSETSVNQIRDPIAYLNDIQDFDLEYFSRTVPKRIEAAFIFLKILGLNEEALSYTSKNNFPEADGANEYAANVMAYLKAHPEYGWQGRGAGNFDPYRETTIQECLKAALILMGYQQDLDFNWSEVKEFAASKGLPVIYEEISFKALEEIVLISVMLKDDPSYVSLNAEETADKMREKSVVLLDVRSLTKRNQGYIEDSEHLYSGHFTNKLKSLDYDKEYIIYGDNEDDSLYATAYLRNKGYNAVNFVGDIEELSGEFKYIPVEEIETVLKGRIGAGNPLSDVYIKIYDMDNEMIFESAEPVTNENGLFSVKVKGLPADFTVTAEKGFMDEEGFDVVLSADFSDFAFDEDEAYINIVTTIANRYRINNPGTTVKQSQIKTLEFLEIPQWVDIGSMLLTDNEFFSYYNFYSKSDDFDGYIDRVVEMMRTRYSFAPEFSMPHSAGGFIAKELSKGALNYLGGELMGWGLKKAGIDLEGEDLTLEQLKAVQEGLKRMESQLADIKNSLNAVQNKLDYVISQLDAVRMEQLRTQYDLRITSLDDIISSTISLQKEIADFVAYPPSNPDKQRDGILQSIRSDILSKADTIHNNLVGSAGRVSLIKLWNQIIYSNRFLTYNDYEIIKTQFDYFLQIQEAVLLLQVEYYHAIESEEGEYYETITRLIDEHESNIAAQMEFLKDEIPEDMIIDKGKGLVIMVSKENIAGSDYLLPPKYCQYFDGDINEIIKNLNKRDNYPYYDDNRVNYDGWNSLNSLDAAVKFIFSDWKTEFDGYKIKSSETLMQYLLRNGWPIPRYYELNIGIDAETKGLGGFPQTKLFSIESESPYKLSQGISGLSINDDCRFIIYRYLQLPEVTRYIYID